MTRTQVAKLLAQTGGRVLVTTPGGTAKTFPTLREAEEYVFSLGADQVNSVKARIGVLYATKPAPATPAPATEDERLIGVCRIGRSGTRWHRAVYEKRGTRSSIQAICGCPGTNNNHATQHSFTTQYAPTCGR